MTSALRDLRVPALAALAALALALALALTLASPAEAARGGKGKPGPAPEPSAVAFAGYDWTIKTSTSRVGPGPNVFDARNVSVDDNGRLHLRVAKRRGTWTSAEVILDRSLGYGTYSFDVATPLGAFDPNVVLGMFTWSDDPAENHREIDIEFGRFGDPAGPNAHYAVQPYYTPGNTSLWSIGDDAPTRHSFRWSPGEVVFSSLSSGLQLNSWTYSGTGVPTPGDAAARINLWLFGGNPPTDGRPEEVVFSGFEFSPS